MKTKEQIELAKELVEHLQDYITLASVEKRLKDKERKEVVAEQLEEIGEILSGNVDKL